MVRSKDFVLRLQRQNYLHFINCVGNQSSKKVPSASPGPLDFLARQVASCARVQASHPLSKSLTKASKTWPGQEKCKSCLPKWQAGFSSPGNLPRRNRVNFWSVVLYPAQFSSYQPRQQGCKTRLAARQNHYWCGRKRWTLCLLLQPLDWKFG